MSSLAIHLRHSPTPAELQTLRDLLPDDVQLSHGEHPTPADYQILVAGRPTRHDLEASPHLHSVIIPFAGLPPLTRETMRDYPHIRLYNLHHNAEIVAEMTMALLLAAAKFIVPIDQTFRQHDWTPRYAEERPAVMLSGRTALILGYGEIGRRVAAYCTAFGMKVLATKRRIRSVTPAFVHPPDKLPELLPRADVLIIALPHTPATEGLIGKREIHLLRQKAILVNIGRAAVVDEAAFFYALKDGRLHAGASDVWYQYPKDVESRRQTPPSHYPFHELDNMVMSPHRSGHMDETETRRMSALAHSIKTYLREGILPNPVDLDAGY